MYAHTIALATGIPAYDCVSAAGGERKSNLREFLATCVNNYGYVCACILLFWVYFSAYRKCAWVSSVFSAYVCVCVCVQLHLRLLLPLSALQHCCCSAQLYTVAAKHPHIAAAATYVLHIHLPLPLPVLLRCGWRGLSLQVLRLQFSLVLLSIWRCVARNKIRR